MHPSPTHPRRGVSLPLLAFLLVVWVAVVGLALDTGYAVLAARQLQNAADAAALAGAQRLAGGEQAVRFNAASLADRNRVAGDPVALTGGDVVVGRYNRSLGLWLATDEAPNAVQVTARRTGDAPGGPVPLFFGPMFGTDAVGITRDAIARNLGGDFAVVTLCGDCPCGFEVRGTSTLIVQAGAIAAGGRTDCAACAETGAAIDAPGLDTGGGDACMPSGVLDPQRIDTAGPGLPDPLGSVVEPGPSGPDRGVIDRAGVYAPGYYSGGIDLTVIQGPGQFDVQGVVLQPGVFVLEGAGLRITGDMAVRGDGVTLVVRQGVVDLRGIARISLSAPAVGPAGGILVFQSRSNTADAQITASRIQSLDGTLYLPAALLNVFGNGVLGRQVVAWRLRVQAAGTIAVDYDGRYPSPVNRVRLVE